VDKFGFETRLSLAHTAHQVYPGFGAKADIAQHFHMQIPRDVSALGTKFWEKVWEDNTTQ